MRVYVRCPASLEFVSKHAQSEVDNASDWLIRNITVRCCCGWHFSYICRHLNLPIVCQCTPKVVVLVSMSRPRDVPTYCLGLISAGEANLVSGVEDLELQCLLPIRATYALTAMYHAGRLMFVELVVASV